MAYGYTFAGKFKNRDESNDYRLREGLSPYDVQERVFPDGSVELSIRMSSFEGDERLETELHNKRRW